MVATHSVSWLRVGLGSGSSQDDVVLGALGEQVTQANIPGARGRLGILADDLTGAHASAVRLLSAGRRAVVVWDQAQIPSSIDALVVNMGTRDDASSRLRCVRQWTELLRTAGCTIFELRIDTTLRGDSEAELAGLLAGAGLEAPLMIAVPAYPEAGRITVDGCQIVKSYLREPESLRAGEAIFGSEPVGVVDLGIVRQGVEAIVARVDSWIRAGCQRMVFDSVDRHDLALCARAVEMLRARGNAVVTLSPGAWLDVLPEATSSQFVLIIVASPTIENAQQVDRLRVGGATVVTPGDVVADVSSILLAPGNVVVIETLSVAGGGNRSGIDAARATRVVLEEADRFGRTCRGLIVTGGATAGHVVNALEAVSLEPYGEIEPLCIAGRLGGGRWSGLPFISKGGVIGSPDTLRSLSSSLSEQPQPLAGTTHSGVSPRRDNA